MNTDPIPDAGTDLIRIDITQHLEAILPYPKSEIAGFVDGIFRAVALYRNVVAPTVEVRIAETVGREFDQAMRTRALRGRPDLGPKAEAKLRKG